MKYEGEARSLIAALGVRNWPFRQADAALDYVFALEAALFEAREDEFVQAARNEAHEPPPNPFDDDDIPF